MKTSTGDTKKLSFWKRLLKKSLILILMLVLVFMGYVEIVNRNSKHMTYRQKILKAVYPAWIWWAKLSGKNVTELKNAEKKSSVSFYSLKDTLNTGAAFDFAALKGKKVLLVNTASDCGYTRQYEDLQQLYEQYKDRLVILAFPANDFKHQEKGTDEEIASFCKQNFGVSFPLMRKSSVIRSPQQNVVFQWLTDPSKNGWNNKTPSWNFNKYLVNEAGELTNYFGSTISPLHKDVLQAIENK